MLPHIGDPAAKPFENPFKHFDKQSCQLIGNCIFEKAPALTFKPCCSGHYQISCKEACKNCADNRNHRLYTSVVSI